MKDIEAKELGLFGSDTYYRDDLAYKNEIHRDWYFVLLNHQSYKYFCNSISIKNLPEILSRRQFISEKSVLGAITLRDISPNQIEYTLMEFRDLENFLIGTAFEIHLKACILRNNYLIHLISKDHAAQKKRQSKTPITITEFFKFGGFEYSPEKKKNKLLGISEETIGFGTICNETSYRKATGKPPRIIQIANEYRKLRNKIHLVGEQHFALCHGKQPFEVLFKEIVDFINTDIVDLTNSLIETRSFSFPKLDRVSGFDRM